MISPNAQGETGLLMLYKRLSFNERKFLFDNIFIIQLDQIQIEYLGRLKSKLPEFMSQ